MTTSGNPHSTQGRQAYPITPDITDRAFVRALGISLAALAVAALLLVLVTVLFFPTTSGIDREESDRPVDPRVLRGGDLIPRIGGKVEVTQEGYLRLAEMSQGEDERMIVSRIAGFRAKDYPYLQYDISGMHPDAYAYLIWRTRANNETVMNVPLHIPDDGQDTIYLGDTPQWSGTVTEIGLDIYGALREEPYVIRSLTLLPESPLHRADALWSKWTGFTGWSQRSVHHIAGTPYQATISPTVATAAWMGTALLLLTLVSALLVKLPAMAFILAVFVPWLASDLMWQDELGSQLRETRHDFADKTPQQRQANLDPDLYAYAERLKTNHLTDPADRIFLLHDSEGHNYRRLRLHYYLLPHNVHSYGRYPIPRQLRDGDYILVLDGVDGLRFNAKKGALLWQDKSVSVTKLDSHRLGQLFRVEAADE